MPGKKYVHRVIEKEIIKRSNEFPVIVLTGPRQTGKSTLLKIYEKPQRHKGHKKSNELLN